MGYQKRKWQDTDYVLSYFGKNVGSRGKYLKFVGEGIKMGRRPELVGGGLIRSMGGWSGVLGLREERGKESIRWANIGGRRVCTESIRGMGSGWESKSSIARRSEESFITGSAGM
jgi:hypothetical protein